MMKELNKWIRSRAATEQALNLHEVARERPEVITWAYALPSPPGWRRCLIDAGVDPYSIIHLHEECVECAICGFSAAVLGTHLVQHHGVTSEEYREQFGAEREVSSESTAQRNSPLARWRA